MNPVVAFVVVMLVWTVSDFISKRTKSLLSSLFIASIIFLIGFLTGLFPDDLLQASSLLALAGVVVGIVIVHLGTMISLEDFKKQWRTLLIGIAAVAGIGVFLMGAALIFGTDVSDSEYGGIVASARDFALAGTGALSGGTISVILVQEAAMGVGLTAIAIFPVLIVSLQGIVGFPLTSIILSKEALRLRAAYRAGEIVAPAPESDEVKAPLSRLPPFLQTTAGTLFMVGLVVVISMGINNLTDGVLNTFVVALLLGITLRATRVFRPSVLNGIDSFGLMMIAVMILVFGPLASVEMSDVVSLAGPLLITFVVGLAGMAIATILVGKLLGYTVPMSLAIGLTSLYGFPGTMVLSQEAARGAGETPEETAAIEANILPKMIVAGFATVTITSVVVTSFIVGGIGG